VSFPGDAALARGSAFSLAAPNLALGRLWYGLEERLLFQIGNRRCLVGSVLVLDPVDGRLDILSLS
jgi:hypothetical protein